MNNGIVLVRHVQTDCCFAFSRPITASKLILQRSDAVCHSCLVSRQNELNTFWIGPHTALLKLDCGPPSTSVCSSKRDQNEYVNDTHRHLGSSHVLQCARASARHVFKTRVLAFSCSSTASLFEQNAPEQAERTSYTSVRMCVRSVVRVHRPRWCLFLY